MSARSRANQHAYHARVLLDSWRQALDQQQLPVRVLNAAFGESVKLQQCHAYGWFLLELVGDAADRDEPPGGVLDLPATPDGLSTPAELQELASLESGGWLGELISCRSGEPVAVTAGSLAANPDMGFDLERMETWQRALMELFDRLRQGMEEC